MTDAHDLTPIGPLVTGIADAARSMGVRSTRSERHNRRLDAATTQAAENIELAFAHSLFAQVHFPYRDPRTLTTWTRKNGLTTLEMTAGKILNANGDFVSVGLPFGPKSRLLLYWLVTEAIRNKSRFIDVDGTFTNFVRSVGLDTNGKTLRQVRDHLMRLTSTSMLLGVLEAGQSVTLRTSLMDIAVGQFEMTAGGRIPWLKELRMSELFYESLTGDHATPLSQTALISLSDNAMAMDIYVWLAHRLRRVTPNKPYTLVWTKVHEQFGPGYGRLDNFKRDFRPAFASAKAVYPGALVAVTPAGLVLSESPPAVRTSA